MTVKQYAYIQRLIGNIEGGVAAISGAAGAQVIDTVEALAVIIDEIWEGERRLPDICPKKPAALTSLEEAGFEI